jgi:hypothetical protein
MNILSSLLICVGYVLAAAKFCMLWHVFLQTYLRYRAMQLPIYFDKVFTVCRSSLTISVVYSGR